MTIETTTKFDAIRSDISEYLQKNYGTDLDSIPMDASLDDIGLDSLTVIAIASLLESRHGLVLIDDAVIQLQTPTQLLDLIERSVS